MGETGMLQRVGSALTRFARGYMPSPFALALLLTFVAFVPSGGGQWAVQGPVLMEAAHQAGMPPERLVLALAYGDQWTNMLQPFWALPLLAITKVEARDIVGYTAAVMLLAQLVFVAALYVGW